MGLKSSPYIAVKSVHLANEIAYGNRKDPKNPLRWTTVRLNLPGSRGYTPTKPWVCRLREDGQISGAVPTYVDDMRPVGCSPADCWLVTHWIATWYCFLGIQVAARKTRPPSQTPGAWAGAVVKAGPQGIGVSCSQDKWDKGKRLLTELLEEINTSEQIQFKALEQKRGFFVHLQ
jgi:hypothetical protein